MNQPLRARGFLLIAALAAAAAPASAEVNLPPVFGDHMVLQQLAKLPIWGTASAGERVTVKIAGQSVLTTADNAGRWQLELMPLTTAEPLEMTVQGSNTVTFKDVRVGEVLVGGAPLGIIGTGGAQLTLELRHDGQPVNPLAQMRLP